jgi:LacI family transcriptional regulator
MARRITISDVAKLAGVSYQTVSRVINNKPEVSPATRQRVLGVIEQTGYRPSGLARGLATSRTATIGMVVPDISNPFFSDIARGIETTAYNRGYNVFLCNTDEDPERELNVLYSLDQKQVDGVVLCGMRQKSPALLDVLALFSAVVMVNRLLDDASYPAVMIDNAGGAREAVRHLLKLGRAAIGFLVGPAFSYSAVQRRQGYQEAMNEAGIAIDEKRIRYCAPTVDGGECAARKLLQSHPEINALFCHNDLVAVGAIQACKTLGRRVPEDVAIIGFDDIHLAALVTPSLTTCRVPRVEMGRQAISLLLQQIEGEHLDTPIITVSPQLILRDSAPTAP